MSSFTLSVCLAVLQLPMFYTFAAESGVGESSLHFDFKTENGQQRVEDIKYDRLNVATNSVENANRPDEVTTKSVEFRGGYSFISADGYEYTVKYKANKNGFQPYVTARKLKNPPAVS